MTNSTAIFPIHGPSDEITCPYLREGVDSSELTPGELYRVDEASFGSPASTMAHDMVTWMRLREILQEDWTRTHENFSAWTAMFDGPGGMFLLAHELGHTMVPAKLLLIEASPEPQVASTYQDIVAALRSAGRKTLAEDLIEMINDMEEDPDEPSIKIHSLRALTRFLSKYIALEDPIIGPDPMGVVLAEWHIDGDGLLVMAFLEDDKIHCVAQADATSHRDELNISVQLTESQVIEEFGALVPLR